MEQILVYITVPTADEARRIGTVLIEERLAACVNIIEGITSIYRWEGKIQMDSEVVLFAKTVKSLMDKLCIRVKSIHSYSVPCIVCLSISGGNHEFLKWIEDETIT